MNNKIKLKLSIIFIIITLISILISFCTESDNKDIDPFSDDYLNNNEFNLSTVNSVPIDTTPTNTNNNSNNNENKIDTDTGSITVYFTDPPNTPNMLNALKTLIDNAQSTIDFSLYSFTQNDIIQAVKNAHNRGVTVRFTGESDYSTHAGYTTMSSLGIERKIRPSGQGIHHDKFFIIDNKTVWTGSTNITDAQFKDDYNNSIMINSSKIAAVFKREFEQLITGTFGPSKEDKVEIAGDGFNNHKIMLNSKEVEVYFSPQDKAHSQIINELKAADHNIYFLANSFTRSDIRSYIVGRFEGYDVKTFGVFDQMQEASSYSQDEEIVKAGIPAKINKTGMQHSKVFIIDAKTDSDPVVITGSYNWTNNGSSYNDENLVIIHSAEVAEAYYNHFVDVWNGNADWHPNYTGSKSVSP